MQNHYTPKGKHLTIDNRRRLCQVSLGKFLKVLDPFLELTNRSAGGTAQKAAARAT